MAKPIPVFAFAFAAFAATWSRTSNDFRLEDSESADANELFLKIWRAAARADGNFMVRIGVVDEGAPTSRLCDRDAADCANCGELWLGNIAETPSAFSGVVRIGPERAQLMRSGERVSFELRHILGWTLGVNATKRASAVSIATGLLAPPSAKLLADLEIS